MSRGRKKKPESESLESGLELNPQEEGSVSDPGDESPAEESQEVDLSKVPSRYHKFYNKGA